MRSAAHLFSCIGFVVLNLSLSSLTTAEPVLYKDTTPEQMKQDDAACRYEAMKFTANLSNAPLPAGVVSTDPEAAKRSAELYTMCMQSKGYIVTSESDAMTRGWYNPKLSREERFKDYTECEKIDPTRNPISGPSSPNSYGSCLRAKGYIVTTRSEVESMEKAKKPTRLVSLEGKGA